MRATEADEQDDPEDTTRRLRCNGSLGGRQWWISRAALHDYSGSFAAKVCTSRTMSGPFDTKM